MALSGRDRFHKPPSRFTKTPGLSGEIRQVNIVTSGP